MVVREELKFGDEIVVWSCDYYKKNEKIAIVFGEMGAYFYKCVR